MHKAYEIASFKALDNEAPGTFQAIVSVFGNVDLQGDRTMPGAFKSTIAAWRAKGDPIPVIWSHEWLNPEAHIGYAMPEDIMEISTATGPDGASGGLLVKGRIDVHKPFAGQVFDLLKERRIREWSFAYDTIKEKAGTDGANELLEVNLIEVGPTLKGANSATNTITAKSMEANERELKQAYEAQRSLTKFLDMFEGIDDPDLARSYAKTLRRVEASPVPERERFHVEVAEEKFACISNRTKEAVDMHETAEDAEAHVKSLESDVVTETTTEAVEEALADAKTTTSDITVIAEVAGQEFKVSPEALEPVEEEKAAGKPWHVEKQGDEYCCIVDSSGDTLDCHATEEDAEAHVAALYANAASDDADGEKTADVDGIQAHLIAEHDKTEAELAGIPEERQQASHHTLHDRSSATGHDHGEADEGKSFTYITATNSTTTGTPISVTVSGDMTKTFTLADAINTELKTALGTGEKVGRTIGRNSATALKEALIRAVDDFVKSVNDRAVEESSDDDNGKVELNDYNAKLAKLLGEEKE